MGQRLMDERGRRAWSRLSSSPAVRHCVRALIFVGAVGVTWLVGSATASAHHSTDPEADAPRQAAKPGVERAVENNTGTLERLLRPRCLDVPSPLHLAAGAETSRTITSFALSPRQSADVCHDEDGTLTAAPDSQAQPRTPRGQREESEGTAQADPDSSVDPLSPLSGETPEVVGALTNAAHSVAGGEIAPAAPVSHTDGATSGTVADPLLDVTRPLTSAAAPITRPAADALTDVTRPVTDKLGDSELPRLDGPVKKLVPLPVAGLPPGGVPTPPASPVTPDVDQSTGTTSTVDSIDEALPATARHAGTETGAPTAPTPPAPAPLPAVPGSGVTTGSTTSSYLPIPGGGVTATVPASPSPSAPESSALLATASDATLRDLAGEPAVSPD